MEEIREVTICDYAVKAILNSNGVELFLWNAHRRKNYHVHIPYELTGKSLEIQTIFTNLDVFYIYLMQFHEDRDRVSINEKGTIMVAYVLKKSKKKAPPVIYIKTEVLVTGTQMKDENKLYRDLGDVKRENLMMEARINELTKLLENYSKEIGTLKEILNQEDKKYQDSSDSEDESDRQIKKKKKKKKYSVISGGQNSLAELNKTVQEVGQDLQLMRQRMRPPQPEKKEKKKLPFNPALIPQSQYLSFEQIFGKKLNISIDPNNKFLQANFRIEGNKVTKINKYGRFQLLSQEVIPPNDKHYFVIYLERISHKLFSLGIVNQNRRNFQNSHQSPELITYFGKTGAIWESNDKFPCRTGGPRIPNKVQIRIMVDLVNYIIKWFMDRKEIASTTIQNHLRGERLVAYIEINYEGDTIYLNERPN